MVRIAISGHRGLPRHTTELVRTTLRSRISVHNPDELTGLSCIADGADTLFAQAVLDHGAQLEVVIPADEYRSGLPADHHPTYDILLGRALTIHRLPYRDSTSEAHMAGSLRLLELSDELYAVWDGRPARGYGGTADVVAAAERLGLPVTVIWPRGATRD